VRAEGLLTELRPATREDHVCWVYDDEEAFAEIARQYLTEGLAAGERLLCVGAGVLSGVRSAGGPLADTAGLQARGALQVLDVRAAYEAGGAFVPEQQLAFYDAATRQAVADGYTGLRVVAELSDLAADPARRTGLLAWEHLADDFIGHGSGMIALCAYRRDLDGAALADVASVHPLVHTPDGGPPFRIWFDGDLLVLAGALDTFGAARLRSVLDGSPVSGRRVVADLGRVDFVDVGGCRELARWAAGLGARSVAVELRGTTRVLRRMWGILGFDQVCEVTFVEAAA
jgi:MEDS: MEthanogen/methylotroph, DcmR Sensory domain/STAS domain